MNSRDHDETPSQHHYGRAQFLADVTWIGLDPEQAFSHKNLRRHRDQLMQLHHPDLGGSAEMAARINVTYSRMVFWLDRHLEKRSYLRMRREKVLAREAAKSLETFSPAKQKTDTSRLSVAMLGTAAAIIGIGLTGLARRQR